MDAKKNESLSDLKSHRLDIEPCAELPAVLITIESLSPSKPSATWLSLLRNPFSRLLPASVPAEKHAPLAESPSKKPARLKRI